LTKKKGNVKYKDEATSYKDYYHCESRDWLLISANVFLVFFGGLAIIVAILFANAIGVINLNIIGAQLSPPRTLYLTSNAFPITAYGSIGGVNMTYIFYGTLQSNGTECINSVAVYPFNYTSQSYSSTPQTITYDPKEVAGIYYSNKIYSTFNMSNGKSYLQYDGDTLLCPSVINAIK